MIAAIALVVALFGLGGSAYAIFCSRKSVNTNQVALATAAASTAAPTIAACVKCHRSVARFSLTASGPMCANCKPLSK